ncbi:hypothetical protein K1719_045758 [Acacia pycnantha]|nr:hypothetical protein K1719_045758 [Acacia pycnantha]
MASSSFDCSINRKVIKKSLEANTTKLPHKKGAWTPQEDAKLAEVIAIHGASRWNSLAARAGLNRNGKSCRLRWLNYLRPNIKRGNMSDQEEDLILRLHKLVGNRWSLIAGRLPGRTDNEIKNYWNTRLCKKVKKKQLGFSTIREYHKDEGVMMMVEDLKIPALESEPTVEKNPNEEEGEEYSIKCDCFGESRFFDFFDEGPLNLEWVSKFLEFN